MNWTKEDYKYAVIDLNNDRYESLASALRQIFINQINTMIEPATRSASSWFLSELFGKVSEERYAGSFKELLDKTIIEALNSDGFGISNREMSATKTEYERLQAQIIRTGEKAKDIIALMEKVQMTGKPQDIARITEFLHDLADKT